MGHGSSCGRPSEEVDFFGAAQSGDLARLAAAVSSRPSLLRRTTLFDRLSALHIAAAHGHLQVVSMALDLCVQPDVVNRHKQTALMLAAMHGRTECVRRLLDAGANILMFDSSHGRTCLHYAAYYGHSDCLKAILSAAQTSPVSQSWGYARFVNVRDDTGATPLHLAARQGWRRCVHVLLENGAIVSASSGAFGFPGSTPLHLAARGGSLDCVRQLLSWGADRLQRDSVGRIPYEVAMKRGHAACAALLNPSSAEPLVWPSPLKFISELEPDAKALLEAALMEANREREKRILKGTKSSVPSPSRSDDSATISEVSNSGRVSTHAPLCTKGIMFIGHCTTSERSICTKHYSNASPYISRIRIDISLGPVTGDADLVQINSSRVLVQGGEMCSICFEQACTIEVRECGHQMCAACTLALCCHTKPNPATQSQPLPTCPFCRGTISRLAVATRAGAGDDDDDEDDEGEEDRLQSPRHPRSRRSLNLSSGGEGGSTSSLMGSIASSIGKMGRRKTDSAELQLDDDKP